MKEETNRLKSEASNLEPLQWSNDIRFKFRGIMTLLDGKAMNSVVNNPATSRCPFCSRLMREVVANPDIIFDVKPGVLSHLCLSILHFGLRSFENLLKIGYHKKFKRQTCTKENREKYKEAKKEIQDAFKTRGIAVSKIRKTGGTSNTGMLSFIL